MDSGYGLPTLYFALQGVAVQIERPSWPAVVRRLWVASWVVAPVGLLFPPAFREEVIVPCLHVLPNLSMLVLA